MKHSLKAKRWTQNLNERNIAGEQIKSSLAHAMQPTNQN